MNDKQFNYKSSGVDIDSGNEAVKKIAALAKGTFGPKVLTGIGGFSGLFSFDKNAYQDPVLVSSTDGVGTKLLIAQKTDRHDSIGIDLLAMCVNDLICTGAEPLFFLDYIACGKLSVCRIEEIVKGMADGCRDAGCSLVGGETAEMPGMYKEGEYDLAGFAVGVVDRAKIITGKTMNEGDILIGLPSSGLHSNGYSLVRKVLFEKAGLELTSTCQGIDGCLGDELLRPTRIYVKVIKKIKDKFPLSGIAHITGGAFIEKIIRIVPDSLGIDISLDSWAVPKIFRLIEEEGSVLLMEMYRTFNMGIGMVLIISKDLKRDMMGFLFQAKEEAFVIGEVTKNAKEVRFI